jgi:hypothetical protein
MRISIAAIVFGPLLSILSVCADAGRADIGADVVALSCHDDSLVTGDPGGNDSVAVATPTDIGAGAVVFNGANLSICPDGDVDLFALQPKTTDTIEARVHYDPSFGRLALRLVDGGGTALAADDSDGRVLRIRYRHDMVETLYVEVSAPDGAENNYDMQMFIAD